MDTDSPKADGTADRPLKGLAELLTIRDLYLDYICPSILGLVTAVSTRQNKLGFEKRIGYCDKIPQNRSHDKFFVVQLTKHICLCLFSRQRHILSGCLFTQSLSRQPMTSSNTISFCPPLLFSPSPSLACAIERCFRNDLILRPLAQRRAQGEAPALLHCCHVHAYSIGMIVEVGA